MPGLLALPYLRRRLPGPSRSLLELALATVRKRKGRELLVRRGQAPPPAFRNRSASTARHAMQQNSAAHQNHAPRKLIHCTAGVSSPAELGILAP